MKTLVVFGLGAPSWGSPTPLGRGVGGYACLHAAAAGWRVKAVARNPDKYKDCFAGQPQIELVAGDGTSRDSVSSLIQGCDACLFAIQAADGQDSYAVDCNALAMMAEECAKANVKLVAVSSIMTSPRKRWHPIRFLMDVFVKWNMFSAKWAGEEKVRHVPGLRYTILRPGNLSNVSSPGKQITFSQFDRYSYASVATAVTKDDVAKVVVEAINNPASDSVSIDIMGPSKSSGPLTLQGVFESMEKDPFKL